MFIRRLVFFAGILFFAALSSAISAYAGETVSVKHVIDGDTLVLTDGTRVRLIGIDAPEIENIRYAHRGEPYGEEARQVLTALVEGQTVELRDGPEKFDRYKRRLAYVYLPDGEIFVNRRMVETGAAEAYRRFDHPYRSEFISIESAAKNSKLGMWGERKEKPGFWSRLFRSHS